mgnify:CR=1 FL=1
MKDKHENALINEQQEDSLIIPKPLSESEVKLSTNNPSLEEGEDTVGCTYSGDTFDIGFNLTYLIEVIDVIQSENIILQLNNSDSGCLISSKDNDSLNKYIIMPMRV